PQQPGGHGDGQSADRGRGLSRALRWAQGVELWAARAGPLCAGVLYGGEDSVCAGRLVHGAKDARILSPSSEEEEGWPRSGGACVGAVPGFFSPPRRGGVAAERPGWSRCLPHTAPALRATPPRERRGMGRAGLLSPSSTRRGGRGAAGVVVWRLLHTARPFGPPRSASGGEWVGAVPRFCSPPRRGGVAAERRGWWCDV